MPRDFKIGWRVLISKPLGSPLTLLSLSVGFSVCFLLLLFVCYSLKFDSDVPDANRLFLVKDKFNIQPTPEWRDRAPFPIADAALKSELVEESVAVVSRPDVPFRVNDQISRLNLLITQPSFVQVFGVHPIQGDLVATLIHPDQIALTENSAIKLFGKSDAIGKKVQIYDRTYEIGAILPDRAANTTVNYSALAGIGSSLLPEKLSEIFFNNWDAFAGRVYLKLKPGALQKTVANFLQDAADRSSVASKLKPEIRAKLGGKKAMEIGLDRFTDIYFDDSITESQDNGPHGSWQILLSIALVALLVLFLVVTNYTNFATMQAVSRNKEIAIRKVLGVTKPKLVILFLLESLTMTLLATFCGLLISYLLLPIFSGLLNSQIEQAFNVQFLCFAMLLGFTVGILAGAYPAWIAIRIKPQAALAARGGDAISGVWVRRILTVVQFSVVIALSSIALVIAWQTEFASHESQGFDPAHMLVVEFPDARRNSMKNPIARNLRDAVSHIPGVVGVGTSQNPLGRSAGGGYSEFLRADGKSAMVTNRMISPNFFDVLGVKPLAGRLFSAAQDAEGEDMLETTSIVINVAASRALRFPTPVEAIDQFISVNLDSDSGLQSLRIVGIAPDIKQESLHELPSPSVYWPNRYTSTLTVKYLGNVSDLEENISKLVQSYLPNEIVNIRNAQSYFNENYETDLRMSKLLGLASIFSIIISAFGIYVLSTYSVERMYKQIAIRKLYGALHRDIASLVGKEFLLLVMIGAAIGLPIATVINSNYLSTFVSHAPVGIWPLILPLVIAVVVAFLATSQQVLKAMRTHPAHALL